MIVIIILQILFTWFIINCVNKYVYVQEKGDNSWGEYTKKFHVCNVLKIGLYAMAILPIIGIVGIVVSCLFVFEECQVKGWEENKFLYWLFKK